MWKVEGVHNIYGTPKWTEYYCSRHCFDAEGREIADADELYNDDLTPRMKCFHCTRGLIDVITGYGRYPAEAPSS